MNDGISQEFTPRIVAMLEHAGIACCILRDGDRLHQLRQRDEIDLLVAEKDWPRASRVLARLGLVRVPAWGHAPHRFFVAYLEQSNAWLKLDVVTRIAFGRPSHALETSLAENCLRRRQPLGPVFVPSPEDELITLLLHCVLDKGRFDDSRRHRLQQLRHQVTDEKYLGELLAAYWSPAGDWPAMARRLDAGDWNSLLAESGGVAAYLARSRRWRIAGRRIRDAALRKLDRAAAMLRPRALAVAALAPDGAGKSTLIAALERSFFFSTQVIYMGLYPKGQASRRWSLPGLGTLGLLATQWSRYLAGRYHQGRGRWVLFDRYAYDSLLPSAKRLGPLRRLRRRLLGLACPAPDLVVVLDAPGAVLFSRKKEHSPERLEQQRQGYLDLRGRVPRMVVVDATAESEEVCRKVTSLMWNRYAEHVAGRAAG